MFDSNFPTRHIVARETSHNTLIFRNSITPQKIVPGKSLIGRCQVENIDKRTWTRFQVDLCCLQIIIK